MEKTLEVNDVSQVAEVRRLASQLAQAEGMTTVELGRVALIATELATNLVKYGKAGTMTLSRFEARGQRGVQLIAVDHGPGIADFAAAARDGHSSSGSLGLGLGVIQRSSSLTDHYTGVGQGSALLAQVAHGVPHRAPAAAPASFELAARSSPMKGQAECGDGWTTRTIGQRQLLCVVDGLGHGPLAAQAAQRAIDAFGSAQQDESPAAIVQRTHEALKGSRGAVMAVLAIDPQQRSAVFCGIGNISAALYRRSGEPQQHLLSVEGIVGYRMRAVREETMVWEAGTTAILHSDGLSARWNLARYPGLLQRHPALIASVLFRDHARDTDDATVLVARGN